MGLESLWSTLACGEKGERVQVTKISAIIVIILDTGKNYSGQTNASKKIAEGNAIDAEALDIFEETVKLPEVDLREILKAPSLLKEKNPVVPTAKRSNQSI